MGTAAVINNIPMASSNMAILSRHQLKATSMPANNVRQILELARTITGKDLSSHGTVARIGTGGFVGGNAGKKKVVA
jgi:hypothetical protein